MSKKTLLLILLAVLLFPAVSLAFGELPIQNGPTINSLISSVLNVVWVVFAAIAVIMFVMSGILFLTSHGEPAKITTAKQAVIWGVAGVVVGIIAFSIVQIVDNII